MVKIVIGINGRVAGCLVALISFVLNYHFKTGTDAHLTNINFSEREKEFLKYTITELIIKKLPIKCVIVPELSKVIAIICSKS
jgi:hypothetical protein